MKDSVVVRSVQLGASAAAASWKRIGERSAGKEAAAAAAVTATTTDRRRVDDDGSTHAPANFSRAIGVNPFCAAVSNRGLSGRPNFDLTFLMNGPRFLGASARATRDPLRRFCPFFLTEEDVRKTPSEARCLPPFERDFTKRDYATKFFAAPNVPILFARYRRSSGLLPGNFRWCSFRAGQM